MKKPSKYTILFLIVAVIGFSCSPTAKLRRAERLINQAKAQGALIDRDTIWSEREVITKQVVKDTVFTSLQGDTVYIQREHLKIKYVKIPGDSVFIEGKCLPDTLKILVPTTVTEIIHAPKPNIKWWMYVLGGFVVGIILCLFLRR